MFTPEFDWITSSVAVSVEEVLKFDPSHPLNAGDVLSFAVDGGAIMYKGAVIRAETTWTINFEAASRYVLFLTFASDGQPVVSPGDSLIVENGAARSLEKRHVMESLSSDAVLARIRGSRDLPKIVR
ncbi:MAG: hypothetical protein R2745_15315 [Vicinamibacterales bacterium]